MAEDIKHFTGGVQEVRDRLNELVDAVNSVQKKTDGFIGAPTFFYGMEGGVPAKFEIRALRVDIGTEAEPEDVVL